MMSGLIPFNRKKRDLTSATTANPFNMIDDFFEDSFNDLWTLRRNLATDPFKVDVRETESEYLIEAELPGIKKEDIDLSLNDGRLTISVDREEQSESKDDDTFIHRERRSSSMQRSLYLADTDPEGISAKLEEGLLKITVAKVEKPDDVRKIDIE